MRRVLLPAILVAAALATPVSAEGSGHHAGPGWAILRLSHEGETRVVAEHCCPPGGGYLSIGFLDRDGGTIFAPGTYFSDRALFVSFDHGDGGPMVERRIEHLGQTSHTTLRATLRAPAFEGWLLIWAASRDGDFSWSVEQGDGGSVELVAQGDGAFISEGEGFDSDRHLLVHEGPGERLIVQENGTLRFSTEGRFVGVVGQRIRDIPAPMYDEVTLDTPTQSLRCYCAFAPGGEGAAGPGDFTIRREAIAVEQSANLILAGVDVAWPPGGPS